MKRAIHLSWIFLLLLALLMWAATGYFKGYSYLTGMLLLLSGVKFLLVAFQFMEVKKAHIFWKTILVIFIAVVLLAVWSATT